ncbi:XRE family transcriptional regulator [Streptomyces chattanoogensis]|uniref:XRE family transcriptional regulator n=1 Tax=Streptomyces chattanoogensis TaxID=66876 RepID=UPI0036C76C69
MGEPNTTLQAVRKGLLMSQDDLARAIRDAGQRAGEPNDANKRLVQRWESGTVGVPRGIYARALESVTGMPIDALGFRVLAASERVTNDGAGGHDLAPSANGVAPVLNRPRAESSAVRGQYSGVWLSKYEYFSSGRDATHTGLHYVVVLQHGNRLSVRSLPGSSDSPLTMDLEIDGAVVTGSWSEQTASEGYYAGARYHGAIQMLVEPTGRRIAGKWVGFGKDFDVNTGPWELIFKDASTSKATLATYNHRP